MRLDRILGGEFFERLVQCQQVVVGLGRGGLRGVKVHSATVAAALEPVTPSSVLDQDSPHGFSGCREKVPASVPGSVGIDTDQPQVCLMNKCRGLQRLAGRLPSHSLRGQPSQLVINQGQQLSSRPPIGGCA